MRAALNLGSGIATTTSIVPILEVGGSDQKGAKSKKRHTGAAPAPPGPDPQSVTDRNYLELVQSSIRWRGAWSDSVPTAEVLKQKRTIRSASIEVCFMHSALADNKGGGSHSHEGGESIPNRVVCSPKQQRSCVVDGAPFKAQPTVSSMDSGGGRS